MGLFNSCVRVKVVAWKMICAPQSVHEYCRTSKGPAHNEKPEKDSLAAANMAAVAMAEYYLLSINNLYRNTDVITREYRQKHH